MKVLVAIDDSRYSATVLDRLTGRSWWADTSFMVLHVVALPAADHWQDWGLSVEEKFKQTLIEGAQKLVDDKVKFLKKEMDGKYEVEGKVGEGHVCETIVQLAADWSADLIILGSHGRSGFEKFLLGSVAEGVALRAPCSVEIVKQMLVHQKKRKTPAKKAGAVLVY